MAACRSIGVAMPRFCSGGKSPGYGIRKPGTSLRIHLCLPTHTKLSIRTLFADIRTIVRSSSPTSAVSPGCRTATIMPRSVSAIARTRVLRRDRWRHRYPQVRNARLLWPLRHNQHWPSVMGRRESRLRPIISPPVSGFRSWSARGRHMMRWDGGREPISPYDCWA